MGKNEQLIAGDFMRMRIEFLDPCHLLVDEVVDWLCGNGVYQGRVREISEGVKALDHIMVVVPTAQSGRSLRLGLAKAAAKLGWGGILPPKIVMQNTLLTAKKNRVATEAEEMAILAGILMDIEIADFPNLFPVPPADRTIDWALSLASSLMGVMRILGEGALLMGEVQGGEDELRWRELGRIEAMFLKKLNDNGVMADSQARREAIKEGCHEEGICEIVLPSVVDIQQALIKYLGNSSQQVTILKHAEERDAAKFDEWGRPIDFFVAAIQPEIIETAPTAIVEADDVARFFREVGDEEAFPALVVCDAEMYPELKGAFQNYFAEGELTLRNPAKDQLAKSALGRLLISILELSESGGYDTLSTFVRMGDVVRWAAVELKETPATIVTFVGALSSIQNNHLPRTIEDTIKAAAMEATNAWEEADRFAAAGLIRLVKAIQNEIVQPFEYLRKIFSTIQLDEKEATDCELIAAAEKVRDLRAACGSELIEERFRGALQMRLIKEATYMLEPRTANILSTTGWLELPWCAEEEIVITGFNEGKVPENIVGHPFVPDSLRKTLGLMTNDRRAMRDSFILAQAVRCRKQEMVRVHLHQIDRDKNVMKPSRLLFLGIADEDLPELAKRLYVVTKGVSGAPPKELPKAWRLKLPIPPRELTWREQIAPTILDQYIKSPFAFYLKEIFDEHADDHRRELSALTFGNICHAALDAFARKGPKDSTDAKEIAAYLANEVKGHFAAYGEHLPAIIELQSEAAIMRLSHFAEQQAARRKAGWRIIASEQSFKCRIKGCPTVLSGKVDRIDEHEITKELAIIDYKTWDRGSDDKKDSIQLPAYRAMVETSKMYDSAKAHTAKAFYCILSGRAEDVKFDEENAYHEGQQSEAEDKIVKELEKLARGIFYSSDDKKQRIKEYDSLLGESIEEGIDPEWLDDQRRRLEEKK